MGASCAFLGVPYALPQTAANRWKAPQAVVPWTPGTIHAIAPAATCTASDDCLKLNIWARKDLQGAPVLVWLHTGSFVAASANFAGTNGRKLAEETGVVVVAPNYRLGPLGFLAHPALTSENPQATSGNYGIQDQRAALAWVRDHIAGFGGDAHNVTLAGTSAGGDSVGLHLVNPSSRSLFHRAIVQSAAPTIRWPDRDEAYEIGNAFASALGCVDPLPVPACLRSKSLAQIMAALPQGSPQVLEQAGRAFWGPIVDGYEIPDQPRILFEKGDFNVVPTIVGTNRDEMWGNFIKRSFPDLVTEDQYEAWLSSEFGADAPRFLLMNPAADFPSPAEAIALVAADVQFTCEARRLVRLIERKEKSTYRYSYEHEIDELSPDHVIHGVESNILFGNNFVPNATLPHVFDATDLALHQLMSGYWTRFAATGNPNVTDGRLPQWPAFRHPTGNGRGPDKYLILSSSPRQAMRAREQQCDFLELYFFRSVLGPVPASAP
jgi:para-nitrobenzyl esterase